MSATRRALIAGNWKMNGLRADGLALADALVAAMARRTPANAKANANFDMLVCPPFTLLAAVGGALNGSGIALGAQDCHEAEKGAHTGNVSAAMLADTGCGFVTVGHSERRTDHGETDANVKAKADAVLGAGMTAIVCLGETEQQRDAGNTLGVVATQLKGSLPDGATAANTVVAYEPVWAIGTGRTPTNDEVQEVHAHLRKGLMDLIGADEAVKVRILYGGSMKPGNAAELLALNDVDGGLIGGASLKAEDFFGIADNCL